MLFSFFVRMILIFLGFFTRNDYFLAHIREMTFYCSHIFRETNVVVDCLANLVWHNSPLLVVCAAMFSNIAGLPDFHFLN